MGNKFLDGYVSLCEGEKDPRNLVLVFAMDRVILIEFDISERVQVSRRHSTSVQNISLMPFQSLYDVIFCYFPITFRPPPNNPGGITADDLRLTLRYASDICFESITRPSLDRLSPPRHYLDPWRFRITSTTLLPSADLPRQVFRPTLSEID